MTGRPQTRSSVFGSAVFGSTLGQRALDGAHSELYTARTLSDCAMEGISHIVIEVSDLKRAEEFYRDILGFESSGRIVCLSAATTFCSGWIRSMADPLAKRRASIAARKPASTKPTGWRLQIVRLSAANLAARHVAVHTTKRIGPPRQTDNFYFHDPDGNRVQLVVCRCRRPRER